MRLYRLPRTGDIAALELARAETPEPGRRQVLIRMRAASLNYRDLLVIRGSYGAGTPVGVVPLSDGAGEVAATGPGVTRVKVGDRVCPIFAPSWIGGDVQPEHRARALGGSMDGVLSEFCLADEDAVVTIPAHLSFEEAATLPCAAVTAWHALFGGPGSLRPGETVLLLGTGGVSVFALQFAHLAGARIVITSSQDDKLDRAEALGATDRINYRAVPDWDAAVRELTGGRGVDHVVEVGGAGTLQRSIASARVGGTVHLIGVLTGGQIDPLAVLRGSTSLRSVHVGSRRHFEDMNRAIAQHAVRPVIDRVFGFEEAADAYRHLEGGGHFGKVVIAI